MHTRRAFLFGVSSLAALARTANPVGCQTNAWQTEADDFEAFLRVLVNIRSLGFEGFEANVRYVQSQAAKVREARARIAETGLRFLGSHTSMATKLESLEPLIELSAEAGAERLVLSGQGLAEDGRFDEAELKAKVEYLNGVGELCRNHSLRLTYHNHQGEFRGGSAEMVELLKRTDPSAVSLMLDAGHAFLAGADVPAFFANHWQRIEGLHLRDVEGGKQVPMGQGEFNQKLLAAAIRESGWSGWLVVEEELRTTDFKRADTIVAADRKFVREVFGS